MKVGEFGRCVDCDSTGVVVTTNVDGTDLDRELARRTKVPLEPSAYSPGGLTCRPCETTRFRSALPVRSVCPQCGRENQKDASATRSFCNDACVTAFLNANA